MPIFIFDKNFLLHYRMAYIIRRDYIGSRLSNEKDSYMQTHAIIASVFQVINHTANVFLYCFVNKHYREYKLKNPTTTFYL